MKSLLFIGLFLLCTIGALVFPQLGVYGYIADYCIYPVDQWWGTHLSSYGVRYSFTLAILTTIGAVLNKSKLNYGTPFFNRQEVLLLIFLAFIWISTILSPETVGRYTITDHPSMKITKIVFFILLMSHILTDVKKLNGLFWVLVFISLILGLQAWDLPRRAFVRGRLEGIGGADFSEANYFGAFMATMLPFIGIQFLRCKKWYGKIVCSVSAAFTANAIVLCRSRGAFLAIFIGVVSTLFFTPKQFRKAIIACLVLGLIGGLYVADDQFVDRVLTITSSKQTRDKSAQSRLDLWKAGAKMFSDNLLGVGAGNWYQNIGRYIPEFQNKDSHNTYVKCAAELGIQGLLLFLGMILTSLYTLLRIKKKTFLPALQKDMYLMTFAMIVSLIILLTSCLTMTFLYAEFFWILLFLPVCLTRAAKNASLEFELDRSNDINKNPSISKG